VSILFTYREQQWQVNATCDPSQVGVVCHTYSLPEELTKVNVASYNFAVCVGQGRVNVRVAMPINMCSIAAVVSEGYMFL